MPLAYPREFIDRVKAEYPNHTKVCQSVETGEYALGRFLASGAEMALSPEQIIDAFQRGTPDIIYQAAVTAIRRRRLHQEWVKMMAAKVATLEKHRS